MNSSQMKILKPGKVEQRKFVCPRCGCVFVAPRKLAFQEGNNWGVICPQEGCCYDFADKGEPYEAPTLYEREMLARLIEASRSFSSSTAKAAYLISNGVTFR